jgi:hypothetical protein
MSLEVLRNFFLWCTIINYGLLVLWLVIFVFAHELVQRIHGRWFHLSHDQFDIINYAGISIYKLGIMLFNLVPFVVLSCLR